MKKYLLYIDETYRLNGDRTYQEIDSKEEAIEKYMNQSKGMVSITEIGEDGIRRILQDDQGRKYIKGSPFYNFPHVPHISKYTGMEIPTT